MGDLDADTAVERVQGAEGRFRARLSRDWEIWGPNGGYVAAVALRAAGAASALPRPATFSAHFLAVADFDFVDLDVTTLRAVKRAESLRISMTQQGRAILEATAWIVGDVDGLEHDRATMPSMPAPATLKPLEELIPPQDLQQRYPFWRNLEQRPADFVPWAERQPGAPEWREWCRFRPCATFADPFVDAARSLLLIDTMGWPAACRAHSIDSGFVAPSLDVNVHFHQAAPEEEWLLADAVAPVAADGLVGAQGRIWAADGRLLASGTGQMLCRPSTTVRGP